MKNTFLGLLSSIWLLAIGLVLIINYVNFNYTMSNALIDNSYFGFTSILKMFDWFKFRLSSGDFYSDTSMKILKGLQDVFNTNNALGITLGVVSIPVYALFRLVQIFYYLIQVPAILIECIIGAFSGTFNTSHDYSRIDDIIPLVMSSIRQFNVG